MDMRAYRQSAINATKFLLSQQQDDGSFIPVEQGVAAYHKVPFALSLMGQGERAGRLCMYLREGVLDEEGDFRGHFKRTPLHRRYSVVANAWLVAGTQRLGQFGISLPGMDYLGGLQHPKSGGFFTAGSEATLSGEQDILSTAVCGLALLYCGRVDDALSAGAFLKFMYDKQPASAARMFFASRGAGEIATEFSEENAQERLMTVGKQGQWYHVPALAAGFLTKLAEASQEPAMLETAQDYLHFVDSGGADRYMSEKSGFVGWAAALLYAATGNQNFRRMAIAVADGLLEKQLANGSWLQASMGEDLTSDVVDGTAENMICMVQILEGLSAGE